MAKFIYHQDGEKKKIITEDILGEESFAGSMPDPEEVSDVDDTFKAEHDMGLYTNEDTEHPKASDLANQVEKAEEKWEED